MTSTALRTPARMLFVLLASVALMAGFVAGPAAPKADAATLGSKAVAAAATRAGMPYVWGATGPTRFDCSGLTQWSYKQAGKKLPRTAAQQRAALPKIATKSLRPGDLVFFHNSSGHVYHVGIYAGNWKIWDAPKPGRVVSKRTIWAKSGVTWGRVA
ncbi:C40 family peptidase [uncultured Pseudokineococcus sp.]|uniref:C40 family peptidase n=1 Tax=uncultured Pseudokineococcus sp. TaxID=1642928 RepID=UPI002605F75C|nr:C40 family peptidase [uncultured Pseudokineococcus sp.]